MTPLVDTRLLNRIDEVAGAIVTAAGGTLSQEVDYALPAIVNDDEVTDALERAAQRVIGQANILTGAIDSRTTLASSWPRRRAA